MLDSKVVKFTVAYYETLQYFVTPVPKIVRSFRKKIKVEKYKNELLSIINIRKQQFNMHFQFNAHPASKLSADHKGPTRKTTASMLPCT